MQAFQTILLEQFLPIIITVPISIGLVIVYVRLVGLRSFSKMTSFDFVITIATGSLLANAALSFEMIKFLQAITAIGALLLLQVVLAKLRLSSIGFRSLISNEPVILFRNGEFDEKMLTETRVAKGDVWAKIREANALDVSNIHAVVLETTGDISVLHGDNFDAQVLEGVFSY